MRARAKQANLETKKANEILLAFKKLDAQRELEADAAIAGEPAVLRCAALREGLLCCAVLYYAATLLCCYAATLLCCCAAMLLCCLLLCCYAAVLLAAMLLCCYAAMPHCCSVGTDLQVHHTIHGTATLHCPKRNRGC